MKKKLLSIVFLFLIAIVLQGCDALYYFTTRDPNATTTSVTQVNPITDSTTSKNDNTTKPISPTEATTTKQVVPTDKPTTTKPVQNNDVIIGEIESSDIVEGDLKVMSVNCGTLFSNKQYTTGNYGSVTESSSSVKFTYYRTCSLTSSLKLIHANYETGIDPLGASILNSHKMEGIQYIEFEYQTYGTEAHIMMGYDDHREDEFVLAPSSSFTTITLEVNNANLFIIEEVDSDVQLRNLSVYYDAKGSYATKKSSNGTRIGATQYEGTLVPGETIVEVPIKVQYGNDSYTVIETKEYTYYTFDYVESHPSVKSDAAMIDPIDVINYYTIFGEFPANYAFESDVSTVSSVFGDDTRVVQEFSRTNGYVQYVPCAKPSGFCYYELDIDVDGSYKTNKRGVGRVVVFGYGFTTNGYGSDRVAVYTDDHYATFQEYLNDGTFSIRFDAEQYVTYKEHPTIETITK